LIRSAATDVPRHAIVNVRLTGIRFLAKQNGSSHDLSGLTIPAAKPGISDEAALKKGMKEVSREFVEKVNKLYAKASGQRACATSRIHRKCVAKHRLSTFGLLPCRFVLNNIPVLDQHAIFDTNDVRRNPIRRSAKA